MPDKWTCLCKLKISLCFGYTKVAQSVKEKQQTIVLKCILCEAVKYLQAITNKGTENKFNIMDRKIQQKCIRGFSGHGSIRSVDNK